MSANFSLLSVSLIELSTDSSNPSVRTRALRRPEGSNSSLSPPTGSLSSVARTNNICTTISGSAFKPSPSPVKSGFVGQQSYISEACKRKELDVDKSPEENRPPKKPRLVFTDIQRRTLHAIFKETKRPSKEMQQTIAQQLGLEVTTVANFFMNARRRSLDKWQDDNGNNNRESVSGCNKS
ncbi:hepatocyte nuclear factor 6-like [Aplysia californica]|uniref:Hepatocyte nuclear factor 6-like n=1 Tax=Aplysia californica TaxID=6500 RepID=A0ABM1W4L6_APLCA|nr:hepatocyte nuclear factor 6-like [Aplysia californica]